MSYSPAGFYQFPSMNDAALRGADASYNAKLLRWLDEAIQEGDGFIQQDPNYDKIAEGMAYVSGDQKRGVDGTRAVADIEDFILNLCRRAMQSHVSALTDLKPTFGWRSMNPKYGPTAELLNKLTIAWYLNHMADVTFGDVMKIAWAGGTADMMIEWDGSAGDGGDHRVIPKDPRDTLPIRPSRYGGVQAWQGVIFREVHSVNVLRDTYPAHAHLIRSTSDGLLASVKGLFVRQAPKLQTPSDPLAGLGGMPRGAGPMRSGDVLFYRCYLTDRSRNMGPRPVVVGDPTKSYSYTVEPGGLLYPRKRLILRTEDHIIYDGPAPYFHGKYPFVRFSPWKLPWFFFGQSALADLRPVQDAINRLGRGALLGIEQWLNQGSIVDTNAVGEVAARRYNSRAPGQQIKIRGQVVDPEKAFRKMDGPNPQILTMAGQTMQELIASFESLAGTGNLEALAQLKQMPAENTLERFYQAMTPQLRLEGRMFEAFLRDASSQIASNTFQFMTSTRRIHMLGDAGAALEDFDYDPGTLVPALKPTVPSVDPLTGFPVDVPNPDYDPMFDASKPRDERAQAMNRLMAFVVAPNSVLAFNAQEEKMMDLQLARMGYLDIWSLMERLERPNMGEPPPIPLPPRKPPQTPEELAQGLATGQYVMDPMSGQLAEMRVPATITERLMAQQMLMIGMTANPAGRKASGGDNPKVESKDGGSRTTVTESEK